MWEELLQDAITALAGHQVTDVETLYQMVGGESVPEKVPRGVWKCLRRVLALLGYRERWVRPVDGGRGGFKWVRRPGPADAAALAGRAVETFTNFG